MPRNPLYLVLSLAIASTSCSATMMSVVKRRAAFDLNCPAQSLAVTELGNRTFGVRGCERQATYLTTGECSTEGNCTAVMNSPKDEPAK